jgi:hypothetical protein
VDLKYPSGDTYMKKKNLIGDGRLTKQLLLKNITGNGFAMFYGTKKITRWLFLISMESKPRIRLLRKKVMILPCLLPEPMFIFIMKDKYVNSSEGEYNMLAYRTTDSTVLPKYALKDKRGNALKVLAFDNDPVTGKPYVSGNIIQSDVLTYDNAKEMGKGAYAGVFTINFNGTKKSDVTESYSYWNDGSQTSFSKSGQIPDVKSYARQTISFKDYSGNTYFYRIISKEENKMGSYCRSSNNSSAVIRSRLFSCRWNSKI